MTTFVACSMTRARLLQEWHDAANRIGSNFRVFAARKARAMQGPLPEGRDRVPGQKSLGKAKPRE